MDSLNRGMGKRALNRIKAVLAEKGKTNNWLAEKLDRNIHTVSKWCTNKMQPTMESLYEIAEALDVDVRELLSPAKRTSSLPGSSASSPAE